MHIVRSGGQFSSEKHRSYQTWGFVCIFFGVILPGILIFIEGISIGIVSLFLLPFGLHYLRRAHHWQKGMIGEKQVVEALTLLDNDYVLINDVILPHRRGNIDHVLVGPNGTFVIETKSYRWHPLNRLPIKQVLRNAILLRQFLKEHGQIDLFIQSILVSTDSRSRAKGKFSTVYMSTLSDLCNTIARVKSSTYIDHDRRKQVVHEILQSQSSLSRLIPQTKSSNQQ